MNFTRRSNVGFIYLTAFVFMLAYNSADAIKCVQCDGGNCSANVVGVETKDCDAALNAEKCFTKIDDKGVVSRGCLKKDDTSCKAEENCLTFDDGKNNQVVCKSCEGSDANCSQTDMSANDYKYNKVCDAGVTKCIAKVDNRLVVRGCASDTEKCNDNNTCKICEGDKCNAGIFPDSRIQCYQCSGDKCNDVAAVASKPCLNFVEKDECYTKGENDTAMTRGCKSDSTENQCSSTATGCVYCATSKCNNSKYKRDQTLKCYQCTGENVDSDCFKEQTSKDFKACTEQILYSDAEFCYSSVTDETIKRGCLHDNKDLSAEACTGSDNDSCTKCNTADGCNNAKKDPEEFACIVCRSDVNIKCYDEADKFTGEKCRTGNSSSKEGCFHGLWNGVAIRGCVIDATPQVQAVCQDKNNNQCTICNTKNCNKNKTSGAGKMTLNLGVLLIVLTTWWNFK